MRCRECGGYGHIQAECATYLKKQNKIVKNIWSNVSDSENSEVGDEELVGNIFTLMTTQESLVNKFQLNEFIYPSVCLTSQFSENV